MHELGVLKEIVRIVERTRIQNKIHRIKHITLEVGKESGIVPIYLKKVFPTAVDPYPFLHKTKLVICMADNDRLVIKDIGY